MLTFKRSCFEHLSDCALVKSNALQHKVLFLYVYHGNFVFKSNRLKVWQWRDMGRANKYSNTLVVHIVS